MKIVAWNVRPDFLSQVKKPVKKFDPSILFLSKTKINASRSLDIWSKLHFDSFDFVNTMGFS